MTELNTVVSRIRNTETRLDKIRKWYVSEDTSVRLTAIEKKLTEVYEAAYAALREYDKRKSVANMIVHRFGVSQRQAYRYISESIILFGDVNRSNKQGLRNMVTETANDIIRLSMKKNPPDLKMAITAANLIGRYNMLDRDDPEIPPFDEFKSHKYKVVLPPEHRKWLEKLSNTGLVDLTGVMQQLAEDAEILQSNGRSGDKA